MFGNDLLIKKYPYMGYSQNILEYFAIIGYQDNFIPIVINSKKKYYPTILTSVTSNTDFGIIDNQLIISQIYPSIPSLIYVNKNDIINVITQEKPPISSVIYSFCFDSTDGKSKLFYTCYAYKFYEKYYHQLNNSNFEEYYYIPKAFCIISQYSFFSLFRYICKNIHKIFTKKENNTLPIELLIYNIVNFIPSPLNYNLYLELFSFYDCNISPIEMNQLSGYPYIDFDLKEVFNILPINLFLEIYLMTIVEQSMLFFSSNLEILNMVMYIMYILNYPCNDSTYFWHIVSVSKDNLNEENKFVGKVMVSMLGVNATYDDCIDTSAFGGYHFIVDIDNKKIILKESLDLSLNEKEDSENLGKFHNYIKDIIKDKNVESLFLKTFIKRLKSNLESIIFKEQDNSTPRKYNCFFNKNKSTYFNNRRIQEYFYDFCLNILTLFYQDLTLVASYDKIKRVEFNNEDQFRKIKDLGINSQSKSMVEGEIIFLELFRGAVKYKTYFENFIQNKDTMDVYKIALLFSDEFINLKLKDGSNKLLNQISFFDIIDKLYYPEKRQIINITVNNLLQLKIDSLKDFFDQNSNVNIKSDKKAKKNQLINLNKKIINKYLYLLNNFFEKEEIKDLFPSLRIHEEQPIINFDRRHIIGVIINYFERNKNLINNAEYLIYAIIYIFCISMSLHSYRKMLNYFENIINSFGRIKFFLRQFGNIIVQTFYKYHILHRKEKKYSEMGVSQIKMYFYMLITFLKQNKIVPNEEMMVVLSKFFGKLIFQERKSIHKKEEKEIDNDADFTISRNENFFCFMKHCFNRYSYIKSNKMIRSGLKEINYSNIHIKIKEGLILKPTIIIKIKDYVYSSYFFSPKKIYKFAETAFNEFNKSDNLDFSKLKIKEIRDCITNLIQYGLEIEKLIPVDFLVYTLYLLRDYEQKYSENNKENKSNDNIVYEEENTTDNFNIDEKNDNIEEKNDNNNTDHKSDNNNIEDKSDNKIIEEKNDNNNIEENNKSIEEKNNNIIKDENNNNNIEKKNDNINIEEKKDNNNIEEKSDNNIIEEKKDNNIIEDKSDNNIIEVKNDNNNEDRSDNNIIEEKKDNNNEDRSDNNIIEEKKDNNNNEVKSDNNNIEEKKDNNIEEKGDSNIEDRNDNNNNENNKNNNEDKSDNNIIEEDKIDNKEINDNINNEEKNDNIEEKKDNNIEDKNDNYNNEEINDNIIEEKNDNNNFEEKKDNNNEKDKNNNENKNNNNIEDKNDDNNTEEKSDNNNEDKNEDKKDNKNDNNNIEEKKDNNIIDEKNNNDNGDDIKNEIEEDNKKINFIKKNEEEEDFKENKKNKIDNNISEGNKDENNYLNIEKKNNENNVINDNKDESRDNKNEEKDKNDILKDDNKIINIIEDDNNENIINKNEEKDKINDNNNKNEIKEVNENEINNEKIELEEKKSIKDDDEIKEEKDDIINIIEDKNNSNDKIEINNENNKEK